MRLLHLENSDRYIRVDPDGQIELFHEYQRCVQV